MTRQRTFNLPNDPHPKKLSCLWCKDGKLIIDIPIQLKCLCEKSKNYGKVTKRPTYSKCEKWRYKFD